jgi:hypothetical protein
MCLSFLCTHLFSRGSGPLFVRGPLHFSVQALLRAVVCLLRGYGRFLFDTFDVIGKQLQFEPLPLSRANRLQFNNHTRAAARSVRLGPLQGSIAKR